MREFWEGFFTAVLCSALLLFAFTMFELACNHHRP